MSEYTKHREFIHDVSNEMAITEGAAKRVRKLIPEDLMSTELMEVIEMAEKHSVECIRKLKEYRTFIHALERKTQDRA